MSYRYEEGSLYLSFFSIRNPDDLHIAHPIQNSSVPLGGWSMPSGHSCAPLHTGAFLRYSGMVVQLVNSTLFNEGVSYSRNTHKKATDKERGVPFGWLVMARCTESRLTSAIEGCNRTAKAALPFNVLLPMYSTTSSP